LHDFPFLGMIFRGLYNLSLSLFSMGSILVV
jgi:hypothetical protein